MPRQQGTGQNRTPSPIHRATHTDHRQRPPPSGQGAPQILPDCMSQPVGLTPRPVPRYRRLARREARRNAPAARHRKEPQPALTLGTHEPTGRAAVGAMRDRLGTQVIQKPRQRRRIRRIALDRAHSSSGSRTITRQAIPTMPKVMPKKKDSITSPSAPSSAPFTSVPSP